MNELVDGAVQVASKLPIVGGTVWGIKKLLGPTIDQVGTDLKTLYENGKNKILEKGTKKVDNIEDGKIANLRVVRDVFWSGSFSDSNITAEYFGGILASSRTEDGSDDTGVYYLDIIKGLSSKQLHLHYLIYNSLNKYFLKNTDTQDVNVGLADSLGRATLFFLTFEIKAMQIDVEISLVALYNKGLISNYRTETKPVKVGGKDVLVSYFSIIPTTLGIQLYMSSQNKLTMWRKFTTTVMPDFEEISLPNFFAESLEKLMQTQ